MTRMELVAEDQVLELIHEQGERVGLRSDLMLISVLRVIRG
jgi:hypothetical protein